MDFKDIIGQPVLVQSLQNAIIRHMVANAYIFNGPKGCGKKTAALIFAAAINCSNDSCKPQPCGCCTSCKKAKAGTNPDIVYVKPSGNTIKINQIREIIMNISAKPYENLHRVIIIENGDKMTPEAQDAFLKTLEEPEGNNVFIILTQNHNNLLPTIISRCQVFNFQSISYESMEYYLKKHFDFEPKKIQFAIEKSNGIIGKAVEILQTDEFTQEDTYHDILYKLLLGSRNLVLNLTEEIIKNKEECIGLLSFLLGWFKDVLLFKSSADEEFIYNKKEIDLMKEYGEKIKEEEIFTIIHMIKLAIKSVDYNISIKNSIDGILLKILEACDD